MLLISETGQEERGPAVLELSRIYELQAARLLLSAPEQLTTPPELWQSMVARAISTVTERPAKGDLEGLVSRVAADRANASASAHARETTQADAHSLAASAKAFAKLADEHLHNIDLPVTGEVIVTMEQSLSHQDDCQLNTGMANVARSGSGSGSGPVRTGAPHKNAARQRASLGLLPAIQEEGSAEQEQRDVAKAASDAARTERAAKRTGSGDSNISASGKGHAAEEEEQEEEQEEGQEEEQEEEQQEYDYEAPLPVREEEPQSKTVCQGGNSPGQQDHQKASEPESSPSHTEQSVQSLGAGAVHGVTPVPKRQRTNAFLRVKVREREKASFF
jgi:hypothetical protein